MKRSTLFLCVCFCFAGDLVLSARLQTTPIVDKGTYRLENQQDGSFLSASDPNPNGKVTSGEYSGAPGQKWIFTADTAEKGKDVYTITPLANENNSLSGIRYLLIKVGHGKRLLQNTQTKLCVTGLGRGRTIQEGECGRDNPSQRWNAQPVA